MANALLIDVLICCVPDDLKAAELLSAELRKRGWTTELQVGGESKKPTDPIDRALLVTVIPNTKNAHSLWLKDRAEKAKRLSKIIELPERPSGGGTGVALGAAVFPYIGILIGAAIGSIAGRSMADEAWLSQSSARLEEEVAQRLPEERAWNSAKLHTEKLSQFLAHFPRGRYAEEAKDALQRSGERSASIPLGAADSHSINEGVSIEKALLWMGNQSPPRAHDLVDCSVFSPPTAPPGGRIMVQVFLHRPEQTERAAQQASLMDSTAVLKGVQTLQTPIPHGARVDITLDVPDLYVDEPTQTVTWSGQPVFGQFLLSVPKTGPIAYFPTVRLSVNGAPVGRIKFRLEIDPSVEQPPTVPAGRSAQRYEYAFLSYASKDVKEVLKRAQALDAVGIKYFHDILSLEPGARWQSEIYRNIDSCDLFLLFWSQAAKESEWVLKEAEYALSRQSVCDRPDIVPVILAGPPIITPPESLKELHFNDRIHYFINAA